MKSFYSMCEYLSRKSGKQMAKDLEISQNHYYQLKRRPDKTLKRIVELKREIGFTWEQFGQCIDGDYPSDL